VATPFLAFSQLARAIASRRDEAEMTGALAALAAG